MTKDELKKYINTQLSAVIPDALKTKIKELVKLSATPPPPATPQPVSYNVDGGAPVFVDISDDGLPDIDANDKVFTDAGLTTPYPDGTYTVTGTDFQFTVAGGIVTTVVDPDGTGAGSPVGAAPADATMSKHVKTALAAHKKEFEKTFTVKLAADKTALMKEIDALKEQNKTLIQFMDAIINTPVITIKDEPQPEKKYEEMTNAEKAKHNRTK